MAYQSDRDRIARELREAIRSGLIAPRAQLPSASQLADRHSVSVRTAQDAVAVLKAEGLVFGRKGRGVYAGSPEDASATLANRVAALEENQGWLEAALRDMCGRLGMPMPGDNEPVLQGRGDQDAVTGASS